VSAGETSAVAGSPSEARVAARGRFLALLGCFFLSGFAALLYQTAWTRQFGAVFGTSELAVATVLAAYMGGLAVGAAAAARSVGRVRAPVVVYGMLELAIAAAALAVPFAIRGATRLEVALIGGRALPGDAGGLASALFYLACSFAILGVPTACMGATLPLLARAAVRRESEIGRRVGALYAINTAGAIGGTLIAGFWLLPALGLHDTVWIGVALNASVFALAAIVARGAAGLQPESRAEDQPRGAPAPPRGAWILPLATASGAVSFAYEVLWTRLLGHVLGGSVYAFATMLASVLLGIALGGALAARWARDAARAALGFAAAELATAALAWAAFAALDRVPALAQRIGAGGPAGLLANAALAAVILVPPSLAIGATFPFAVRVLARSAGEAGQASARVYAWNTVGAIVGSIAAGFALLPALGFAGTLTAAVAANLALAAAAAWLAPRRGRALLAAAALAGLALGVLPVHEPWRLLRTGPLALKPAAGEITYFGVGRAATVLLLRNEGHFQLRTNGLPESSIGLRGSRPHTESVAAWLGALPALVRSDVQRMLVVGLGGGAALEGVPAPVGAIDVIELEPRVVAANRAAAAERRADPLADPRVSVRINDARSALLLADTSYDAIVSQPSHPWGAGASHLYTREFFELARERLKPDGVFVQWIGLAFVDEGLLRSLLASLLEAFPHVRVYRPAAGGVLFLASPAPFAGAEPLQAALAAAPRDLAALGIAVPEDLAAALALDEAGARALAQGAEASTDDRNRLAMRSPRILEHPLGPSGADALFAPHDPLLPPPPGLDAAYLARRLASMGQGERAERVARSIPDPARRAVARAGLAIERGQRARARRLAEAALAIDADLESAREVALLAARPLTEGAASDAGAAQPTPLGDGARAVAEGWRLEAAAQWPALRDLDARLGRVDPRSVLAPEAVRLRTSWRLAIGGPEGAREGLELLDPLLARFWSRSGLALRADLAAAAGELGGALATWMELADHSSAPERKALARDALARVRAADDASLPPEQRAAWAAEWAAKLD